MTRVPGAVMSHDTHPLNSRQHNHRHFRHCMTQRNYTSPSANLNSLSLNHIVCLCSDSSCRDLDHRRMGSISHHNPPVSGVAMTEARSARDESRSTFLGCPNLDLATMLQRTQSDPFPTGFGKRGQQTRWAAARRAPTRNVQHPSLEPIITTTPLEC
jgi:hypothetical protein